MRVFISWHGDLSRRVAETLRTYLPVMMQGVDIFMSEHDLGSGSRWSLELAKELEESSFGILCLTPDNLASLWILYEAGALTKHIEGRACGLLIRPLNHADIEGPLTQFQNRIFSKEGLRPLLRDINTTNPNQLLLPQLDMIFEKWWPDLERGYEAALKESAGQTHKPPRDQRDLLEEMLTRIRAIERTLDLREIRTDSVLVPLERAWGSLTWKEKQMLREVAQAQADGTPIPLGRFPQQDMNILLKTGWVTQTNEGIVLIDQLIQEYLASRGSVPQLP
jgi:TIR domain